MCIYIHTYGFVYLHIYIYLWIHIYIYKQQRHFCDTTLEHVLLIEHHIHICLLSHTTSTLQAARAMRTKRLSVGAKRTD